MNWRNNEVVKKKKGSKSDREDGLCVKYPLGGGCQNGYKMPKYE